MPCLLSGNQETKELNVKGRKNVHAFVNGIRQSEWVEPTVNYQEVSYNPYTMEFFQYKRIVQAPTINVNGLRWIDIGSVTFGFSWLTVAHVSMQTLTN